jgi:hypothetical protein
LDGISRFSVIEQKAFPLFANVDMNDIRLLRKAVKQNPIRHKNLVGDRSGSFSGNL